jgi:hypothetical protein
MTLNHLFLIGNPGFFVEKSMKIPVIHLRPIFAACELQKIGYFYITEECGIDSYIIMDSYSILYIIVVRCYKLQTWHLICKICI